MFSFNATESIEVSTFFVLIFVGTVELSVLTITFETHSGHIKLVLLQGAQFSIIGIFVTLWGINSEVTLMRLKISCPPVWTHDQLMCALPLWHYQYHELVHRAAWQGIVLGLLCLKLFTVRAEGPQNLRTKTAASWEKKSISAFLFYLWIWAEASQPQPQPQSRFDSNSKRLK